MAWETGRVRLFSITGITYVTMVLVFLVLGCSRPFVGALVPTTGFFLSTLLISILRASLGEVRVPVILKSDHSLRRHLRCFAHELSDCVENDLELRIIPLLKMI